MNRLDCIRQAQAITDLAFENILNYIEPGLTDAQVARKIDQLLRYYGSDKDLAFKTLVCSGKRTALFHGPTSAQKIIKKNEPIYLDFGARYKGWCSDMTRTVFVGKPSKRLKEIYQAVLDCQELQLALVKAKVSCAAIDESGREYLKSFDLEKYFIHTTGHGVGKLIHQKPRISYKSGETLHAGQVITIEPGVYIKGLGGVRIEDMVIVTKNGCENLSQANKQIISI